MRCISKCRRFLAAIGVASASEPAARNATAVDIRRDDLSSTQQGNSFDAISEAAADKAGGRSEQIKYMLVVAQDGYAQEAYAQEEYAYGECPWRLEFKQIVVGQDNPGPSYDSVWQEYQAKCKTSDCKTYEHVFQIFAFEST